MVVTSNDSPSRCVPPSELSDRLADPINRFVRYPAARLLSKLALKTPLQADHVTFAHLAVGLVAAGMVLRGHHGVIPWALLELRMILDCLDGVIARARGTSSARGRANDEVADAAGFLALIAAITIQTHQWALGFVLLDVAAFNAAGYAVLKRRLLATPLTTDEAKPARSGPLLAITRFGDRTATKVFWPSDRKPERAYVTAVSLMSWDNALPIVHLGVLTGAFAIGEAAAIAYGGVMLVITLLLGHLARVKNVKENRS